MVKDYEVGELTDFLNSLIYGKLWEEYKRIARVRVVKTFSRDDRDA